jgi:hypothetical protein
MEHSTPNEGRAFRWIVGLLCVVGSLLAFGGLYFVEIPKSNEQALLLALGYLFGWGSAVVQSEYGATSTGRKAAESAIRGLERQTEERPSGTEADPLKAKIVNEKDDAVRVREEPSEED